MENNFNPLVSIVIPVYNGEKYMREAIDSALAQTYKNVEVIVVNDGSKDKTDEIAKSYGDKIRYFKKENGGVSTALNLGIENMRGEYFSWLSHDDVYLPEKIETQIEALRGLEDKTTVVYSGWKTINENSKVTSVKKLDDIYPSEKVSNGIFILSNRLVSGCSVLIPKILLEKYEKFDETLRTTQDYDLWFKLFRNNNIFYDGSCNTLSREHTKQVSRTSNIHASECSELWISFFESLTDKEIKNTYSSKLEFYENMAFKFISEWHYDKATEYVYSKYLFIYNQVKHNDQNIFVKKLLEELYKAKKQIRNTSGLYEQILFRVQNRPFLKAVIKALYKIRGKLKK